MIKFLSILIFLLILVLPLPLSAQEVSEDDYDGHTVIKEVEGIRFEVEEDRPIIQKEGYVAPLEYNKYMSIKIKKLQQQIGMLKESLEEAHKKIEELDAKIESPAKEDLSKTTEE